MKKSFVIYIFLSCLFALTTISQAEEIPTPDSLEGCKIITIKEAKALIDSNDAAFFDVRNPINYGRGHLPGALSLPFKGKVVKKADFSSNSDNIDLSKLPEDRMKSIVFYSHGATGWKSYFAAKIAIQQGFKSVMWMRNGYGEWKANYGSKR